MFNEADIANFDKEFDKDEENRLEKLRKNFVEEFPQNKIQNLKFDEYIVGKQKQNSFCYCIETKLEGLGNIHSSPAIKFGVYYGKQGSDCSKKYRFAKKYGKNLEECFFNVKSEIVRLIQNGETDNIEGIKNSKLPPIYRRKILSTYFPEKYLNIFSENHLNHFLINLNILDAINLNFYKKQQQLLTIKNQNIITKDWSNYKFSWFLYRIFDKPTKNQDSIEKSEDFAIIDEINKENLKSLEGVKIPIYEEDQDKQAPVISNGTMVYPRNKRNSIIALKKALFKCEIDENHPSFIRKNGGNYTEPHHLIPMKYQNDFEKSLDVPANIVSLCSNCHNQIHYGKNAEELIKFLYEQRKDSLKNAKISIGLKKLLKMYK